MNTSFEMLYEKAHAAGKAAAAAMTPTPMIVGDAKGIFSNEIDYSKPTYYVADGVCGFAWINIKPATSAFARWLKKKKLARRDEYYGGLTIWVSDYNQSMERKSAYAGAFTRVLNDNGIKAYSMSRMD